MAETTDQVARVQNLKRTIEAGRTRRAQAQAAKDQAEQSLAALLAEHGVTSIEELASKATEAQGQAELMLSTAEQALAQ